MIRPLRDLIVAVPCEEVGRVGALYMPGNKLQALRTHRKMLVLAAGPKAQDQGIEHGVIIHASESWGELMQIQGKTVFVGRSRDINGICVGEQVLDNRKYAD